MLKGRPVSWTKIAVLLINVPMIVLGGVQPGSMNTTVLQVRALLCTLFLLSLNAAGM